MKTSYSYRATAATGRVTTGIIEATSPSAAADDLRARGLFVMQLEASDRASARREPIRTADLALGLRILADLLESGVSISRALHAFEELAPRAWRAALPHFKQAVREGQSFAAALSSAPIDVPPLVIGIVQAGEAGSGLGAGIRRSADLMEASAETLASIRSALAYPIVVASAGFAAVMILITVVLPRFARILDDLGQRLPASTRLVIDGANAIRTGVVPAAVMTAVAFALWHSWRQTEAGRRTWHRILLLVPVLGTVREGSASARIAHSLSAMLETGLPMSTALAFAARAAGDFEIESRLMAARSAVASGETLSRGLGDAQAATPTVVRLAKAGEESGRLPSMLQHAARIEQQRVDRIVRTGVRLLEPILLLTFASVVALIAAALLQAIYSVRPTA